MKINYNTSDTYSYMKMSVSQTRNIVGVPTEDLNKFNYLPVKLKGKKFYYPVPKVEIDTMYINRTIEITV